MIIHLFVRLPEVHEGISMIVLWALHFLPFGFFINKQQSMQCLKIKILVEPREFQLNVKYMSSVARFHSNAN